MELARSYLRLRPLVALYSEIWIVPVSSRRMYRGSAQRPLRDVDIITPGKEIRHLVKKYVDDELLDIEDEHEKDDYEDFQPLETPEAIQSRRDYIYNRRFKRLNDPKEPSLLTWAAKCQIKYLHGKSPEEWTPQKISENFPISQFDAARLVRNTKLLSRTKESIEIHDTTINERWKALKSGKSGDVTKEQRKRFHEGQLLQSASRGVPSLPSPPIPIEEPRVPQLAQVTGPFTALIKTFIQTRNERLLTKYPQLSTQQHMEKPKISNSNEVAIFSSPSTTGTAELFKAHTSDPSYSYDDPTMRSPPHIVTVDDAQFQFPEEEDDDAGEPDTRIRRLTLQEIKARDGRKMKRVMHDEIQEKIIRESKDPEVMQKWFDKFDNEKEDVVAVKAKENAKSVEEVAVVEPVKKDLPRAAVKIETGQQERITIPAKQRKPGGIYRLKDSFYDEKGIFLYRVPGLEQAESFSKEEAI